MKFRITSIIVACLSIGWILYAIWGNSNDVAVLQSSANAGCSISDSNKPLDAYPENTAPDANAAVRSNPKGAESTTQTEPSAEPNEFSYRHMIIGSKNLYLGMAVPPEHLKACLLAVDRVWRLTINTDFLTPELIDVIAEYGDVENLVLDEGWGMSDELLAAIPKIRGVEKILIRGINGILRTSRPKTDQESIYNWVEAVVGIPNVKKLETGLRSDIDDRVLEIISTSTSIEELIIHNVWSSRRNAITTIGLRYLGRMTQLTKLTMENFFINKMDHKYIKELDELLLYLPSLEYLNLNSWSIRDSDLLDSLPALRRLKRLDVRWTPLTDGFYSKFEGDWQLETLLPSAHLGDTGLAHIATLPNLKQLELGGSKVTDVGLIELANARSLEVLNLYATNITPNGINYLKGIRSLKELYLGNNNNVTAEYILNLANEMSLTAVDISENDSITYEYADKLLALDSITKVYAFHCKKLSKKQIKQLTEKYPQKQIVWGRYKLK